MSKLNDQIQRPVDTFILDNMQFLNYMKTGQMSHFDVLNAISDMAIEYRKRAVFKCMTCQRIQLDTGYHKCIGEPVFIQIKKIKTPLIQKTIGLFDQT